MALMKVSLFQGLTIQMGDEKHQYWKEEICIGLARSVRVASRNWSELSGQVGPESFAKTRPGPSSLQDPPLSSWKILTD